MKRDVKGTVAYWNKWVDFGIDTILRRKEVDSQPGGDLNYRPQFVYELVKDHYELMLRCYSRGDTVTELAQYFPGLLDAWEEAERLGKDVWSAEIQYTRHAWAVNLDHYIRCFWLTGLALTLNVPEDQWQRLLVLMGNEGEDALLDRVIASRQPDRPIGRKLCFPKAYGLLLEIVEKSEEDRPRLLRNYLNSWFSSLKNAGSPKFPRDFRTPYWWDFCADESLGMKGAYFGCWCIEAVAVVEAFGIDDSLCLDHPNYPGDLIKDGRSPRHADTASSLSDENAVKSDHSPAVKPTRHWLSRLLLGPEK